jgi:hypothetical protein
MRYISLVVSIVLFIFLISGCGEEDEESPPTTGSVSGMITFIGAPPQGMGEIQVSIFSTVDANGRPTGPPDHYCEAFEEFTGEVPYKISGVSFGTYKLAAVGYEAPDSPPGTPQTILGMYGFAPPGDMQPDSFAVSEDQPDVTGIDIIADYAMISN